MIDGKTAKRIYNEVAMGKTANATDTPEERGYRERMVAAVARILADGGGLEMLKEDP
jgi:hypothetical protein